MERVRKTTSLLGPAFVAAIAYVDPGNVATNISGGARFGYLLVWVLVVANCMASLVQYLSAKVGLVTGKSLPELVRDKLPRWARISYWLQAELVAAATDIAEVLGGALALNMLFGLPLVVGGIITVAISIGLLLLQNKRQQKTFERVITGLLGVIVVGFIAGLFTADVSPVAIFGGLVPDFAGRESVLLAAGMVGATIMPHVVYLHSALARDRHGHVTDAYQLKPVLRATRIDVAVAMVLAGGTNLAMLLLGASALHGMPGVDSLNGVYAAIHSSLGGGIALFFALGLLASGFASSAVGSYAGSVIMGGLLQRAVPITIRRLATAVSALLVLICGVEPLQVLVISQVVLSFGIPFAIVPLILISGSQKIMGEERNGRTVKMCGWLIATLIVALNIALLCLTFVG
jgi:manganese transport protein